MNYVGIARRTTRLHTHYQLILWDNGAIEFSIMDKKSVTHISVNTLEDLFTFARAISTHKARVVKELWTELQLDIIERRNRNER